MREGWHNNETKMMDFKRALWGSGVYTKPTPRDIWYISTEHTDDDITTTLERVARAVVTLNW